MASCWKICKHMCSNIVRILLPEHGKWQRLLFWFRLFIFSQYFFKINLDCLSISLVWGVHTSVGQFLVYLHVFCNFLVQDGLDFFVLVYSWFSLQFVLMQRKIWKLIQLLKLSKKKLLLSTKYKVAPTLRIFFFLTVLLIAPSHILNTV